MPVLVVLVTLAQVVRHTMVQAVLPTLAQEALVMPGPLTMVRVAHATAAQVVRPIMDLAVQHFPVPAGLATTGLADLAIQVRGEAEAAAVQQSVGDP